ncbi:YcxB-like protein [Bosea sp. BK604]|nr:YcxB-like protein [Bosea sp. BK604]
MICSGREIGEPGKSVMNRAVTITLVEADYVAANRLHLLNQYKGRGPVAVLCVLIASYILVLAASFAELALPEMLNLLIPALLLWLLGARWLNYLWFVPRATRRLFRQQKTLHRPMSYSWSQAGLKVSSENGEWLFAWADYLELAENGTIMLVYEGPRLFQMLPKRFFTSEQLADLRRHAGKLAA